MKKVIIGATFLLTGSLWCLVLILYISENLVMEWKTSVGRFITTACSLELEKVLVFSVLLILFGFIILVVEYLKKEDK